MTTQNREFYENFLCDYWTGSKATEKEIHTDIRDALGASVQIGEEDALKNLTDRELHTLKAFVEYVNRSPKWLAARALEDGGSKPTTILTISLPAEAATKLLQLRAEGKLTEIAGISILSLMRA